MSRSGRYTVNPDEGARVEDRRPENRDLVNGPQQAANSLGNTPDYYGDRGMNGRENESLLMKPVTLSPSWEEQNKPEDELNFKTVVVTSEPKDRFNFVYIIMLIHGIGVLMPWNMFITAEKYFTDYKLATNTSGDTEYRDNFMSYLGIASQIPNVLLNFINLFVQCGGNPRTRIPEALLSLLSSLY
ncbi:PREDICTED: uncharacterized protein LOC106813316 [Priapulus caudatus]|uniref:Uncharacterized protein LOC106813316 n=1 Tax=Priapulus caudatus TaxID=37621 RepID=A0ABM1EL43_PRICU|nr:PREDICTED: uncharacterized protein LOC106813316 [Priapulus caudatus]